MDRPIPDSYWVVEGVLLAGEYAGAAHAGRARKKLGALLDAGIRAFFDLTEAGESSAYDDILPRSRRRSFGFRERSYDETRRNLEVVGTTLSSRVNGRSYRIGELTTPSVRELREEVARVVPDLRGALMVSSITGDVRAMHRDPAHRHALFQVASQFNLLEMTGPDVTPEDGVTRYARDRTQGPACALAAAAATVYRNYFVPQGSHIGQTRHHQIDCLQDLGLALGNARDRLWRMRNGYALCSEEGLATITRRIAALDTRGVDELRDLIWIGIHRDVQVTDAGAVQLVSQAFCSALPVSYSSIPAERWEPFATLVLEGAYEATLWAAALNARKTSSPSVTS